MTTLASLAVGDALPTTTRHLTRDDLRAYADASGDHNPIHLDEQAAMAAGLPGIIAHGMLTMGVVATALTTWAGNPGAIVDYSVRFTRPVVVGPEGATLTIDATVREIDLDAAAAILDLTVTCDGRTVLGRARATVRLP